MGNGAICTKVEKFDESVQMPSISPTKRSSTSLSFTPSYKSTHKKAPPPPILTVQDEGFAVKRNADQYSSVWDPQARVSF
jgi:hypothetical protein